ncbi:MAG: class I SAM-dependent RNA methyltransferase [Oscillospiraceae bacterium]|nr:class I SAM-dependent RNA methyltransferase [Oscillospiraceae bacterium]
MELLTYSVPCLFGLEGLVGDELRRMDLKNVRVENGRVLFDGDLAAMARANLRLRMGERVLLRLGTFPAGTFEELFQGVLALPLEEFIPKNGAFPVKGHTLNSRLHSVPDCQAIVKKAAAKRLGEKYRLSWLPEDRETYQLQFAIMKDQAEIFLDTSGPGLHKRGWRAVGNDAPLRETLAAAMVTLARYRGRDTFWDPFCGSGTIVIEAALAALNRAPGLGRRFAAEQWRSVPQDLWQAERRAAMDREFRGDYRILGRDNDPESLAIARSNAKKAGVAHLIDFAEADATRAPLPEGGGVLVCNPPYGERMLEQRSAQRLYQQLGRRLADAAGWKQYIISSEPEFERYFGKPAVKKRKLYNGMILCNLYMYF